MARSCNHTFTQHGSRRAASNARLFHSIQAHWPIGSAGMEVGFSRSPNQSPRRDRPGEITRSHRCCPSHPRFCHRSRSTRDQKSLAEQLVDAFQRRLRCSSRHARRSTQGRCFWKRVLACHISGIGGLRAAHLQQKKAPIPVTSTFLCPAPGRPAVPDTETGAADGPAVRFFTCPTGRETRDLVVLVHQWMGGLPRQEEVPRTFSSQSRRARPVHQTHCHPEKFLAAHPAAKEFR